MAECRGDRETVRFRLNFPRWVPIRDIAWQLMSMLTQPNRNLRGQNIGKNRLTSGQHGASLAVAATLLAGFLFCSASGSAQTNGRATATLRLRVYVVPVVSAARSRYGDLSGLDQGNLRPVVDLSTHRWEPLETVHPLSQSPWAGIVSEAQGAPPTLAQPKGFDAQASSDHSPQTPSKPLSTVPPNEEIILRTFTYVPK
jgi:hypothetical protein